MNRPADLLISVVIPVYNGARYLDTCLGSVLSQSYREIEVILVDDGSTDASRDICERYAAQDSRVRVVHQENQGPATARNAGIEQSRGAFLFFLDSDDSLEPGALETLIDSGRAERADLTIGDFRKLGQKNAASGYASFFANRPRLLTREAIVDYAVRYARTPYLYTLFVHCWGKLYVSRIVKDNGLRFNVSLHNFEDVAFNFDYLGFTDRVLVVDQVLYNYLIQPESQSFRIGDGAHPWRYREAFDRVESFLRTHAARPDAQDLARHLYISCMIIMLIRACGRSTRDHERIRTLVSQTVRNRDVRQALPFYRPSGHDSRVIPLLMRLELVRLIILVCRFKYARHRGWLRGASAAVAEHSPSSWRITASSKPEKQSI